MRTVVALFIVVLACIPAYFAVLILDERRTVPDGEHWAWDLTAGIMTVLTVILVWSAYLVQTWGVG